MIRLFWSNVMIWWFKSSTVTPGKFLTLTLRPPSHNPCSKTPLTIESPTINVMFFDHCSFSVVVFSLAVITLKVVLRPIIFFFLFLIFTSFSCFFIELIFPRFQLFISCWESFWSLLVLLIFHTLISFLSNSFVSSHLLREVLGLAVG